MKIKDADLYDMTNQQLVDHHNSLGPVKPLKQYKGKKDDLILKIMELAPRTVREVALEHLCHTDFFENKLKDPSPDNQVKENHEQARSVGLPYDRVIRLIQDEFPLCNTSVACLRWYAVKVRADEEGYENYILPQRRPRVKSKG